jgi:hypothetical protein
MSENKSVFNMAFLSFTHGKTQSYKKGLKQRSKTTFDVKRERFKVSPVDSSFISGIEILMEVVKIIIAK